MIHESVGQWAAVIGFLAAAGVSAAYLIYQKSIINTIQDVYKRQSLSFADFEGGGLRS